MDQESLKNVQCDEVVGEAMVEVFTKVILEDEEKMQKLGQLTDQYYNQSEELYFIAFEYLKTSEALCSLLALDLDLQDDYN